MGYQVALPGNRTAFAPRCSRRETSGDHPWTTASARPNGCAGKIEGRYSAAGMGNFTIVFRSGTATTRMYGTDDEELECWMSGKKILVHRPGTNEDMPIDINDDGKLDSSTHLWERSRTRRAECRFPCTTAEPSSANSQSIWGLRRCLSLSGDHAQGASKTGERLRALPPESARRCNERRSTAWTRHATICLPVAQVDSTATRGSEPTPMRQQSPPASRHLPAVAAAHDRTGVRRSFHIQRRAPCPQRIR
jgi:hypothetical protein